MNAVPFDTLHYANRLRAVGFTDEQAQVITELQRSANDSTLEQAKHDYHLDDVSTKRDLKELETALTRDLKELEASLTRDLKELEASLTRDLKELETALTRDLKELESNLTRDLKALESALNRDVKELETRLKHEIELLRADTGRMIAETNQRIAESKAELIRWVVGVGVLQMTLIAGLMMKLTHAI